MNEVEEVKESNGSITNNSESLSDTPGIELIAGFVSNLPALDREVLVGGVSIVTAAHLNTIRSTSISQLHVEELGVLLQTYGPSKIKIFVFLWDNKWNGRSEDEKKSVVTKAVSDCTVFSYPFQFTIPTNINTVPLMKFFKGSADNRADIMTDFG